MERVFRRVQDFLECYKINKLTYYRYRENNKNVNLSEFVRETTGVDITYNILIGVKYNNTLYKNIRDLSNSLDLDYNKLQYYLHHHHNYTIEEAVEKLTNTGSKKGLNPIQYEGVMYTSEAELCSSLNVTYQAYKKRKYYYNHKGIEFWLHGAKSKYIEYKGVKYLNKKDLCERLGINYNSFIYQLNSYKEKTVEDIVFELKKLELTTKGKGVYKLGHRLYTDDYDLCKDFSVELHEFIHRRVKNPTKCINYWLFSDNKSKYKPFELYSNKKETSLIGAN